MQSKAAIILILGIAVLASMSIFTVHETERAIKLQLGEVRRADYEPGLHFKLPLFQNVIKFDARIQTLDSEPQFYLTLEKKQVIVDSFVKWKVDDVARFYTSTGGGNVQRANDRLSAVILKQLKDEFGQRNVQDVVSGERKQIMDRLGVVSEAQAKELGLEIIDVRIKRVDLPEEVSQSVYDRMRAERLEVAKQLRSEGEERARSIRAEADREVEVILANAEREAQFIRGEGDAEATATYAKAFGQDQEFFALYRSLDAYRATFNNRGDVLVLEPNAEFFRYFNDPMGNR